MPARDSRGSKGGDAANHCWILTGIADCLRVKNKVKISIDFPFNKKKLPAYFDESSYEYENIHSAMRGLEAQGYISIVWKKGKEDHIISKVVLNQERLDSVYQYVKRIPKADLTAANIAMLENNVKLEQECVLE